MKLQLDELLDTEGAAAVTGLAPATLVKYRCIGVGPKYVKYGRLIRYTAAALQEYISAHAVDPAEHVADPARSEAAKERMRRRVLARAALALSGEVRVLQ